MRKIRDIICTKTNYDEMYNPNESCIGSIVFKNNNSFEGIMMDGERKEEFFIFGILDEDGVVEVIRASSKEEELPRSYKASNVDGKYYGDYYIKTAYYEYPIGECQVSIIDPLTYREINEGEEVLIETHKYHHILNFSNDTKDLYDMIMNQSEKRKINSK